MEQVSPGENCRKHIKLLRFNNYLSFNVYITSERERERWNLHIVLSFQTL